MKSYYNALSIGIDVVVSRYVRDERILRICMNTAKVRFVATVSVNCFCAFLVFLWKPTEGRVPRFDLGLLLDAELHGSARGGTY